MIGMLVSDKDTGQIGGIYTQQMQAVLNPLAGNAGIHKNMGVIV